MVNGFFAKLTRGLTKTRDNIVKSIDNALTGYAKIDEELYEELEEILIMGDIGVNGTSRIMEELLTQVHDKRINDPSECKQQLLDIIRKQMNTDEHAYDFEDKKIVIFVIGVNGIGKTTSAGKLAAIFKNRGSF